VSAPRADPPLTAESDKRDSERASRLLACIGRIYAVSFAPVRATSASHPGRSWHRPGEPHAPREGMLEPDAGSRRHHAAGRHGLRRRQPRRREENVYDSEDAADVAFEPSCASALRAYRASHARRIVSAPPSATLRAHANQAPKNPAKTSRSHPPFPHACRHRTIHQPPLARPALLSSTCLSSTSQSPPEPDRVSRRLRSEDSVLAGGDAPPLWPVRRSTPMN
jgi:hypothetical protein